MIQQQYQYPPQYPQQQMPPQKPVRVKIKRRRRVIFRGWIRRFLAFFLLFTTILYTFGSFVLTVPGMGLESQKFIKDIEQKTLNLFPQGKYVITAYKTDDEKDRKPENETGLYEIAADSSVRMSFVNDIVSAIDFNDGAMLKNKDMYEQFANDWYKEYWSSKIDNKEDIDLHDVAVDLIKFDKAAAAKFFLYGYTNVGIKWMVKKNGIKELYSKDVYREVTKQQTVVNQSLYESKMQTKRDSLTGALSVIKSPGTNLINNKIWFINQQIESIKLAINNKWLHNQIIGPVMGRIFKGSLTDKDLPKKLTIDDLYSPWFTQGLTWLKWGTSLIFTCILILPLGLTASGFLFKRERGYTKKEKKQRARAKKVKFKESVGGPVVNNVTDKINKPVTLLQPNLTTNSTQVLSTQTLNKTQVMQKPVINNSKNITTKSLNQNTGQMNNNQRPLNNQMQNNMQRPMNQMPYNNQQLNQFNNQRPTNHPVGQMNNNQRPLNNQMQNNMQRPMNQMPYNNQQQNQFNNQRPTNHPVGQMNNFQRPLNNQMQNNMQRPMNQMPYNNQQQNQFNNQRPMQTQNLNNSNVNQTSNFEDNN
ncbi:hypothetical protein [Spiroplasma tabanidicola]|uniref:Uncharacterized protein n=1 Tax=Spiroplasma tabanidicola TaxID=324079 RepID=A0A6I6CD19_9MOLU|nr:hypothetical protein [Spiroplasma tabanidicola]QGS51874.1 hypothetical protein STABA_v1c05110 [Spiroplasma tabanidicola]